MPAQVRFNPKDRKGDFFTASTRALDKEKELSSFSNTFFNNGRIGLLSLISNLTRDQSPKRKRIFQGMWMCLETMPEVPLYWSQSKRGSPKEWTTFEGRPS
ncbi:hypothetical protein ACB098_03G172000 [Castanea mollissima]